MVGDNKEVFFDVYCQTCEHFADSEVDPESPCYDCIEVPVNQDSHKPVNWSEKNPG